MHPPLSSAEQTEIQKELVELLGAKASLAIQQAILGIVGDSDIIVLSALGLDARQILLDCFIEQCKLIKKEITENA